uniref:Testis ecdysiotropin peptide 1 n=1 Tax=Lymantria dispar TaxID=13123 RepID=ECD1_LYMDI|nr:RecName: Full=Testis ecdysiotropin peptide 1; Short=TE [Lymantria dispar]
ISDFDEYEPLNDADNNEVLDF